MVHYGVQVKQHLLKQGDLVRCTLPSQHSEDDAERQLGKWVSR